MQRSRVFRQLQSERHRQGMLQPCACDNRGLAMLNRQAGESCNRAVKIRDQGVDGGAQAQHRGGVDHILAGRAPVHVTCGGRVHTGDLRSQHFHQRNRQIAGLHGCFGQRGAVERFGVTGFCDADDGAGWNDADRGFSARKGVLEVQHMLQIDFIVAHSAHGGARQQGCEQGRQGRTHDARTLSNAQKRANSAIPIAESAAT